MRNPFDWLATLAGNHLVIAIVAGVAGGLVRWITGRESWREGLSLIVAGLASAVFLGLWVAQWLPGDATLSVAVATYTAGIGGIGFAGIVLDVVKGELARRIGAAPRRDEDKRS